MGVPVTSTAQAVQDVFQAHPNEELYLPQLTAWVNIRLREHDQPEVGEKQIKSAISNLRYRKRGIAALDILTVAPGQCWLWREDDHAGVYQVNSGKPTFMESIKPEPVEPNVWRPAPEVTLLWSNGKLYRVIEIELG